VMELVSSRTMNLSDHSNGNSVTQNATGK
jgi:hypothetical protein